MTSPFRIKNQPVDVSVSIGMVSFSERDDVQDPNIVFEKADQALAHAKKEGRNRYCYFDRELKTAVTDHSKFEDDIRSGIQNDQFFPYYQPIYCLENNEIEGFEALARWQHSEGSLIYPQQFITSIEKLNFMPELTRLIITKACADILSWSKKSYNLELHIAINVSNDESVHEYLFDMVRQAIDDSDIQPQQLDLEFDSSVLITQTESTIKMLNQFNDIGVNLTINNVGNNEISLWNLANLPISSLKIDMSLIQGIGVNLSKEIIVKVILDMAKQFSLKTIAVGVETEEQAEFLLRYGCDSVQGYLYSRPLNFEDCSKLFTSN